MAAHNIMPVKNRGFGFFSHPNPGFADGQLVYWPR